MYISVVVPLFSEELNIDELYNRLKSSLDKIGKDYELIFIDDGSRDGTFERLARLYKNDNRIHLIKLGRNFGQTTALAAGFDYAQGDIIISMDGDLQHDPGEIPKFLEKIEEGYDVVSGWRKTRLDGLFTRRIPSFIANWLVSKISGIKIHDFGTTFKAYRKDVIKNIGLYGELHRFIPALASWSGATICEIPIRNVLRPSGKSHYGLFRTFKVMLDLLTVNFIIKYMSRPLHVFGMIGLFFFGIGTFVIAVLTICWAFFSLNLRGLLIH